MVKWKNRKVKVIELLKTEKSKSEILRKLNLKVNGGNMTMLGKYIKYWKLDISNLTGQGWMKGLDKTDPRIAKQTLNTRMSNEQVFVKNSLYATCKLYKRLINLGYKNECKICQIKKWQEKKLRFHVDHINGDSSDHRLSNLRLLCPNCHSQTRTYGNKKR